MEVVLRCLQVVLMLILCAGIADVDSRVLQVIIPEPRMLATHPGLQAHNRYRAVHHAPPLNWSDLLAAQAQSMAQQMATRGGFATTRQETATNLGQNLAKLAGSMNCDQAGEVATNLWYSQARNYSYSDPRLDADTDTFTQVVWKYTTQLGVGCAETPGSANGHVFVVAVYKPAGNIPRLLRDNVLHPGPIGNDPDVYSTLFRRQFRVNSGARQHP